MTKHSKGRKYCRFCGKEILPHSGVGGFCSQKCKETDLMSVSECGMETTDLIMRAKTKPAGVSDVRWRIELRRRATHGGASWCPDPDVRIYKMIPPTNRSYYYHGY